MLRRIQILSTIRFGSHQGYRNSPALSQEWGRTPGAARSAAVAARAFRRPRRLTSRLLHAVLWAHDLAGAAVSLLVRTGWVRRFHTPSGREVGRVERQ